jgi:hypothetical protein
MDEKARNEKGGDVKKRQDRIWPIFDTSHFGLDQSSIYTIMATMKRVYQSIMEEHFEANRQMCFLSGPRQVGKTTAAKNLMKTAHYLDWDDQQDRIAIIQGQSHVAAAVGQKPESTIIFDELHKYADWKNFIKGFFDKYEHLKWKIVVTGSSRLDTYRKGGDSLTGRYFHFQMHPLSPAELVHTDFCEEPLRKPSKLSDTAWNTLLRFGGFPEPFLKASGRFHRQWSRSRQTQLIHEDIRGLGKLFDVAKIEVLSELVALNATRLLNYSSFARVVRSSVESIQRWISLLQQLSYCFTLRPWKANISRSIVKEPKIYLTDWSQIDDVGRRNENFVACALLKAVQGWTDSGFDEFSLHYIRTKEKREVDFVVAKSQKPWFLVEVKTASTTLSPQLEYFQNMIGAEHALQVVIDEPYREIDCFDYHTPTTVSARTFLTQLV